MIVVTGGAGFIGRNIVKSLNINGENNILIVDDIKNKEKISNLSDLKIKDFIDYKDFISKLKNENYFSNIKAILHHGAISDTTNWDAYLVMQNNYEYSKKIMHWCIKKHIQFIYASSASIYANEKIFKEFEENGNPLNVYGYSKYLFDQYVKKFNHDFLNIGSQIVGLRYFNVYGLGEQHKGRMSSVIYQFNNQVLKEGKIKLFKGSHGFQDGEQKRDFVYIDDVIKINLWFMKRPLISGIFNVGTGVARSFNEVANLVCQWFENKSIKCKIVYVDFPEDLINSYQSFTCADLQKIRNIGFDDEFHSIEEGVNDYLSLLNSNEY